MEVGLSYTIAIGTLGCKVNQAESEALGRQLEAAGHHVVPFSALADAYLLHTCTVTHVADRKARQVLRQARRLNPDSLVVALGCGAAAVAGLADLAIPHGGQTDVLSVLIHRLAGRVALAGGQPEAAAHRRTRAIVKVQDGCDHRCTYCIVPLVRGRERSRPAEAILAEVGDLVEQGYQEVVVTGPQLGSYFDPAVGGLPGLVRAILWNTSLTRLRLSSLEPHNFPPYLLDLWPERRLCRHFHISLQSGSDAVLARMGRGYRMANYEALIDLVRRRVPGAAITSDVIVGFPGETDEEFARTAEAVERIGFSKVHVFPFSPRPGTPAAEMRPVVPEPVKWQRSWAIQCLGEASAAQFRTRMVGEQAEVLYEEARGAGQWSGLSDNYVRVTTPGECDPCNRVLPTRLVAVIGDGLAGRLIMNEHIGGPAAVGAGRQVRLAG